MLDSLEERLLLIPMVVGVLMEVAHSQEKIQLKLIDLLHTMLDMLQSHWWQLDWHIEF